MDTRPIFAKYQIPLTDTILFEPSETHVAKATTAAERFVSKMGGSMDAGLLASYSIFKPVVYRGIIASGDKFVAAPSAHSDLSYEVGDRKTLAVEMEGAAIAQVCDDHGIPYTVIRTISDKADHSAVVDFQSFVTTVASQYSAGILKEYFDELAINALARSESAALTM